MSGVAPFGVRLLSSGLQAWLGSSGIGVGTRQGRKEDLVGDQEERNSCQQ